MNKKTDIERKKQLPDGKYINVSSLTISVNKKNGSTVIFLHSLNRKVVKEIDVYPATFYDSQKVRVEDDSDDNFIRIYIHAAK